MMEQGNATTRRPLLLLDDAPLTKPGAEDRLAAVVDELVSLARDYLEPDASRKDRCGLRIGLFGGFGQGKTSALRRTQDRLSKIRIPSTILRYKRRVRILSFDVALYLPADLEFELDRVLAASGLGGQIVPGRLFVGILLGALVVSAIVGAAAGLGKLFMALLGLAGLVSQPDWGKLWDMLAQQASKIPLLAFGTTIVAMVSALTAWIGSLLGPPLRHWLRGEERRYNFGASLALRMDPRPDCLLVDNLDRASLDQQRAFLRALYKHADSLSLLVIVAMDESALRNAPPNPEDPEELLRKAIHAECRLPVWLEEDPPGLVRAICEQCIDRNPYLQDLLRDPLVLGDLVRVLVLLPGFGPRRVKRFLNDLLLLCHQLGRLDRPNRFDISALCRLRGIYDLAPRLRGEGERLINALERNRRADLELLADHAYSEDADRASTGRFAILLRQTRAMEPANGLWRALVGQLEGQPARAFATTADPGLRPRARHLVGPGAGSAMQELCFNVANGYGGLEWSLWCESRLNDAQREGDGQLPLELAWPAVESALMRSREAGCRRRLYEFWESVTRQEADPTVSQEALFRLFRVWVVDQEVLDSQAADDQERLRERILGLPTDRCARLLFWWPDPDPTLIGRMETLLRLGSDLSLGTQRVRLWLADARLFLTEDESKVLPDMTAALGFAAYLGDVWPGFREGDLTDPAVALDLRGHFSHLRLLHEAALSLGPRALRERFWRQRWLERQLDLNRGHCVLGCLVLALRGATWDLVIWEALQPDVANPQETSSRDRFVAKLLSQIAQFPAIDTDQAQTGLLLACTMGSAENIEEWAGQVGALRDSGLVRLHLDMPGNRLWQAASPASLAILLGRAMVDNSEQWREARVQIEDRLPDLLRPRPDYAECLEALRLDLDVAPGP